MDAPSACGSVTPCVAAAGAHFTADTACNEGNRMQYKNIDIIVCSSELQDLGGEIIRLEIGWRGQACRASRRYGISLPQLVCSLRTASVPDVN